MKRIFLILIILFSYEIASSQILISLLFGDKLNSEGLEFGLVAGANVSGIGGLETKEMYPAFNLGFYFDILMKDNWYLHTGVMVKSTFGATNLTSVDREHLNIQELEFNGSYDQIVKGFHVPVLIQYRFNNFIYLEAGPEFAWLHNSNSVFNSENEDIEARIKENNKELLNWFNGGVAFGIGYQLMQEKGWDIGVRYSQAFTDVFKSVPGSKNHAFLFYAKIPVGVASVDE